MPVEEAETCGESLLDTTRRGVLVKEEQEFVLDSLRKRQNAPMGAFSALLHVRFPEFWRCLALFRFKDSRPEIRKEE